MEDEIRKKIPADEMHLIIDNIGLSPETFNYAFGDGATISSADGEILIALNEKHHAPSRGYIRELRTQLNRQFPDLTFFFQPADIVTQILNFGLPSPIDVQIQDTTQRTTRLHAGCASALLPFPALSMSTCTRSSMLPISISISTVSVRRSSVSRSRT